VVFYRDGKPYRQVNPCYKEQYERLISSGLYKKLTDEKLLVPHRETDVQGLYDQAFLVLEPEQVPFVSYPYEWCFGQMKDAALTTLRIQRTALVHDMFLKDASAYNIQFSRNNAVHIDTLSFDLYKDGMPWVAYGQFCRHFLAPLFLMAHTDIRLSQLMRVYIDGIPLDLASKLLKGKGGFAVKQHIHWHSKSVQAHGQSGHKEGGVSRKIKISKFQLQALIDSLIKIVAGLTLKGVQTEWGDYYSHTNYSEAAEGTKRETILSHINRVRPETIWDFGANDGTYSRLGLLNDNSFVAAFDIDPIAVERNYNAVKKTNENMLPLLLDLTNPSPSIGFAGKERGSVEKRQKPDCILMLAVIHHLAISNNLPLEMVAEWLASFGSRLIIEFVPKTDSQARILLATRDDIFPNYTVSGFEEAFANYFKLIERTQVAESDRLIYLMEVKHEN
jgi:hypothetical protein